MSRPYININSSTYNGTTDVVTFDVTALRLRGETSLTVGGFTSSQTISLTSGRYLTQDSGNFTFSANLNGTSSNNLGSGGLAFSPASAVFEFSGTATGGTTKTVVKISVFGSTGTSSTAIQQTYQLFGGGGYQFTATQSAAAAVETLRTNIGALPLGATATTSGNTLTITAPYYTGVFYNGNDAKIVPTTLGHASGGWTHSSTYYSGTWSGGVTTITVPVSSTNFGQLETQIFRVG